MGCPLNLLVPPLGGSVDADDQPAAVDPAEVAAHEGVARLGLLFGPRRETQVPRGILLPRVPVEVGVALIRGRLHPPQSLSRTYCRPATIRGTFCTAASLTSYLATSAP